MRKFEKQAIALTSICHGMVHVLELTFGIVLISIADEFGTGLFTFGILANVFGLAFGLTALPSGYLADRMSERRLLILCCLGMGLSSIAVGLSPDVLLLGVALSLLGVSLGILHPTGSTFVARIASQRGQGFGYFGIGGNLGVALGPLLAGVIASAFGWRASYLIFSIPALLLGAMFFLTLQTETSSKEQSSTLINRDDASLRPVILFLVMVFFAQAMNGLIYRGVVTFLPSYMAERATLGFLNVDGLLLAGSFTTIALIFGVAGIFLGGYLSDRIRPEILALMIALILTPLLLMMGSSYGPMLIVNASAFAFVFFMGQPVYNFMVADYSPDGWRGRMYGLSFFSAFGLGSFSATLLGYIAEKIDTKWIFWTLAGFELVVFMSTIVLLVKTRKRRQNRAFT